MGFVAGAIAAGLPRIAKAAPVILEAKCGAADVQTASSIAIRAADAFRRIERESDGAVKIQLFTDDVLGNSDSQLTQLRTGAIQFLFTTGTGLSGVKPLLGIEGVAFLFTNYKELFVVYDGPLATRIRSDLADAGIVFIGKAFAGGPLDLGLAIRPVRVPGDLQGLKVRVSNAKTVRDAFTACGAIPASVPPPEIYTASQTHLIDGFSAPLEAIENKHLYEVVRYLALSAHAWANYLFLANADAWRPLPDKYKAIVTRNIERAAALQRRDNELLQTSLADKIRRRGLGVNAVDVKAFRTHLSQYYVSQKTAFGGDVWTLVENVVGKLA
jgi:tripartite ATP-independent transporter DctP family solute receptor